MPRNSFKCPECGANYKHCHRKKGLENKKKAPDTEVYICDGQTVRHPHLPIMIRARKIMVREGEPDKAKQVLHTLELDMIYVDPIYDYLAEWREYMAKTFSENGVRARMSWHSKRKKVKILEY